MASWEVLRRAASWEIRSHERMRRIGRAQQRRRLQQIVRAFPPSQQHSCRMPLICLPLCMCLSPVNAMQGAVEQ